MEIIPLHHASDSIVRSQLNQSIGCHRSHPSTVKFNGGFAGVENLEDLSLIGRGIVPHLFFGQGFTGFGYAGRISDHPGEITDQEDDLVAEILKVLQFMDQDRMPKMKVRCRWIKPRLNTQGTILESARLSFASSSTW